VTGIPTTAMGCSWIPEKDRRDFRVCVAGPGRLSAPFRLISPWLARLPANFAIVHQSPKQMPGKTAAAVFDDVKSLVCIELGVPM